MNDRVVVPFQPTDSAWVMPYTSETRPTVARIAPGTSYFVSPVARDSLTKGMARATAMIAIGTLTSSVQCQEKNSVRMPPATRPIAAPPPEMAPKTPKAFARSWDSVNVTEMSERAAGASRAAKTPWSARAAYSISALWEMPPRKEAKANPIRPTMNMRLRPWKSAMRPPSRSRPPKASV